MRHDFEARCTVLQRLACLPPLAGEPYDALTAASSKQRLDQLLLQSPAAVGGAASAEVAAEAGGPADAWPALACGVAALGSPQFEARARMLALCGWDLKLLTAAPPPAAAAAEGEQQEQQRLLAALPTTVGPESAALQCSLCAAKAGLWACFSQCKPLVLPPPARRSTAAGGAVASPSATVAKVAVSRNVAADIGTTIAGGAMEAPTAGGAAAAPFGEQQPAAFGSEAAQAAQNAAGHAASAGEAQQSPAAAAHFGSNSSGAGVPVFGFAALQAPRMAAEAGDSAAAGGAHAELAGSKRKQPDFSWSAVMADIDEKAAAEKRSKAAAAGGAGQVDAGAAALAAMGRGGQPASRQQRQAAAAAIAAKYNAMAVVPLDPLALHRPFCPWVSAGLAGDKEGRCGWRWCLQQLAAPVAASAGEVAGLADDAGEGEDGGGSGKGWDPAKLLRSVLQQVDVHK